MSLKYRYQLDQISRPALTLGGRWVRPRPVVPVALTGPTDSRLTLALLDTGSDDTVFSEALAVKIGIDLSACPTVSSTGIGMGSIPVRLAEVSLRIADQNEQREWKSLVGFTSAQLVYNVLGFAGCLQFFTAVFRGDVEQIELEINSLYPGI